MTTMLYKPLYLFARSSCKTKMTSRIQVCRSISNKWMSCSTLITAPMPNTDRRRKRWGFTFSEPSLTTSSSSERGDRPKSLVWASSTPSWILGNQSRRWSLAALYGRPLSFLKCSQLTTLTFWVSFTVHLNILLKIITFHSESVLVDRWSISPRSSLMAKSQILA